MRRRTIITATYRFQARITVALYIPNESERMREHERRWEKGRGESRGARSPEAGKNVRRRRGVARGVARKNAAEEMQRAATLAATVHSRASNAAAHAAKETALRE